MTYHDNHDNNKEFDYEPSNQDSLSSQQEHMIESDDSTKSSNLTNQDNLSTPVVSANTKMKRKPAPASKWSIILSGMVGGITVALIGFLLLTTGVIQLEQPNTTTEAPEAVETSTPPTETQTNNIAQPMATDNTEGNSLSSAIQSVSDAVVGVSNIQQAGLWTPTEEAGTGSGVIYKKENGKAYVVTNNHVVDGASEVEIILPNGEHEEASVLGADDLTDLAVLEMDGSNVTQVATLGSSANLAVADTAIAIGNPLGTEFAGSVTKGIISGLERSVEMDLNGDRQPDWTTEVIQTDAAINPGNSGGALINANGEVIGINSMKIAQAAVEGIGFAIPIDEAKPVIEQLEQDGKVSRPFVGISAVSLSTVPTMNKQQTLKLGEDVTDGVVLAEVQTGSPADKAGLERYDVVTKMDDKEIGSMMDLKQYLYSEKNIGEDVNITYFREGKQNTTSLTLSEQ